MGKGNTNEYEISRAAGLAEAPVKINSALVNLLKACDQLEKAGLPEQFRHTVYEIRKQANAFDLLLFRTQLLMNSALSLAKSDIPSQTLEKLLDDARFMVSAERGFILIYDQINNRYEQTNSVKLQDITDRAELKIARKLAERAHQDKAILHYSVIHEEPSLKDIDFPDDYRNRSVLVVPIDIEVYGRHDALGVIYLDSLHDYYSFTKDDAKLLNSFASLTALSIRNIRLTGSLRLAYYETVCALVKTLEAKDKYTKGHSDRVAEYSERCAKRFKIGMERLKSIYSAALLHDIGKIGIRDEILNKPDSLTDAEYTRVKAHPEISQGILVGLTFFEDEMEIIRQHHERYDGKGYPRGLKGSEISLEGAIVQVADAWDAMTSKRVYRDALNIDEALAELAKNSGTQFNPQVVDVFCNMIMEDGIIRIFDDSPAV